MAAALDSPALDEGLGVGTGAERPEPLKERREGSRWVGAGAGFSPLPDETRSLSFPVCETRHYHRAFHVLTVPLLGDLGPEARPLCAMAGTL